MHFYPDVCNHLNRGLYVSEHFFFDVDAIFIGCLDCGQGHIMGDNEPWIQVRPGVGLSEEEAEEFTNNARRILKERAIRINTERK